LSRPQSWISGPIPAALSHDGWQVVVAPLPPSVTQQTSPFVQFSMLVQESARGLEHAPAVTQRAFGPLDVENDTQHS
jgi:hypothetical protein